MAPKEKFNRFGSVAEWNPVRRAFRTAGLVRGALPYVLIWDDIQKDDAEHAYSWLMQLADDLELIESKQVDFTAGQKLEWYKGDPRGFRADLVLAPRDELQDPRGRRLLVRVLQNNRSRNPRVAPIQPGWVETYQKDIRGQRDFALGRRLVIPSRSVAPDYKVMLFPYRAGQALPVTTWNESRTVLAIEWPDRVDTWTFQSGADGRTRATLSHAGATRLALP